jgi:hypothetical protein
VILEQGLRAFLADAPTISALVIDRIYGLVREQGNDQTLPPDAQLPAVLIQRTTTQRQQLFCGTSPFVSADVQVDSYAITGDDAWGLAKALRTLLVDFTGNMGETWVDTVHLTNEFPLSDPDPGIIRITQLYNIWYLED